MQNNADLPGVSQRVPKISADELVTSRNSDDILGTGNYACVRRCKCTSDNKVVAAKCYSLTFNGDELQSKTKGFLTEVNSLARIEDKHIVKVVGYAVWNLSNVAIIMEYAQGKNLRSYLHRKQDQDIPWPIRLKIAYQLSLALQYLHNYEPGHALRHGDVKPQNIIITKECVLKLTDFGAAQIIRSTGLDTSTSEVPLTDQSTILYAPPEVENLNVLGDMYSLAIVVYEIITRITPFSEYEVNSSVLFVLKQIGKKPTKGLDGVGSTSIFDLQPIYKGLKHIMENCWHITPENRWTASQVVEYLEKEFKSQLESEVDGDLFEHLTDTSLKRNDEKVKLSMFNAPFEDCPKTKTKAVSRRNNFIEMSPNLPALIRHMQWHRGFPSQGYRFTMNISHWRPDLKPGSTIYHTFSDGNRWRVFIDDNQGTFVTGFIDKINSYDMVVPTDISEMSWALQRVFPNGFVTSINSS